MTNKQDLYNVLFKHKTELQKIELSSIKVLEDDDVRMKKGLEKLKSLRAEMKKVYISSIDGANTNYGIFKQKAKELGLNPDDFPLVKNFIERQRVLDDAFYSANNL